MLLLAVRMTVIAILTYLGGLSASTEDMSTTSAMLDSDTWYVLEGGSDKDGCGRTSESACSTLLYLLQQVNRTHLPPSTGIKISTDKCLNIDQQAAGFLDRLILIEKYAKSSTKSTITVTDVDLFFKETLKWIFSGVYVKIWQCKVYPIGIVVQSESHSNQTEHLVENPEIVIHNSSFHSLDLKPGTKAEITDCYIDAQFKTRPTLIAANNSDVSIQKCHFENFINENGSTVLYGHYYSHVIIENSVFNQHSSSKGVLFLQNSCYIYINSLIISENVASSSGFSAISLLDGIHAVMINTVFRNNSAVNGGTLIARFQCKIALTDCIFSSNKAITGKTLSISKNTNLQISAGTPDQNSIRTATPTSPTLFSQTSSNGRKPKVIAPYLHVRSSILKKNSVQQEDGLLETKPGQGGAIYVATQSQLLVTNCSFEDNSAQSWAGSIITVFSVTLRVQETTFVGNKAQLGAGAILAALNSTVHIEKTTFMGNKSPGYGGAINVQQQAQLRITNCVLDDNISGKNGGGILAARNATLEIQETKFTRNSAVQGGAIDVVKQTYLRITNCVFDDNISKWNGGAIFAGLNATLKIHETNFTANRGGLQGGAIVLAVNSSLCMVDCTFKDNRAEVIGGALAGGFRAVIEINRSYFSNNSATSEGEGGAINAQQQANLSLTNCRLERNFAGDNGGAIVAWTNVILRIRETNFTGNSAHDGGALNLGTLTDCHVVRSVFNYNTAKGSGGAVYADSKSSVQVKNTNFTNSNAIDGGAIYIDSSSELQTNMCSFWKNFGNQAGGAIMLKGYSTAVIERCHFLSNNAGSGGAVYVIDPKQVSVLSTFLLRNVASDTGGAISISNGTGVIINNITCAGNKGSIRGGCLFIDSVTLTLTNSDVIKNSANILGAGVHAAFSRIQIISTLFKQNYGDVQLYAAQTNDILLQMCNFTTNTTAVTTVREYSQKSPGINFRIAQSSFSVNTSDQHTKVIYFDGSPQGSWMLWETKFQINSYHTISSNKNFTKNLDKIVSYKQGVVFNVTISETQYASASPLQCSNNCWCHYFFEEKVNVLNCSHTNITSLTHLPIPNETMWLVAKSNHIPYLQWSENLNAIQHFDLQNSGVRFITDDFFSKIKSVNRTKFINLANNGLKVFPKSLNGTNFSQVYLVGNPIDCNCQMLWFADWLNTTDPLSENRIVKDYKQVVCVGGKWNGTQVYKLNAKQMGCYPKIIAKWIIAVAAGAGSFLLAGVIVTGLIIYRWREVMFLRYRIFGTLTKEKPDVNEDEMKYDAFFCFSTDDFRWIREVFMSSTIGFRRMGRKLDMEKDDGFTLHLLPRDSRVGGVTSHNVVDAIDHSKRVIVILSANFLEYEWGMEAFMIAHDRMVNGKKDLLIVILKEKINVDRLPADLRAYIRTRSYIDGTKDWKTMKKRLRFQMPHVPLKVLRGQQDEEDIQDQYYDRFQAPGTSTEEEAERAAADNDSGTSHSSHEDITTDVGEASEEGMARYLGRHTGSIDSANERVQNDQNNTRNIPVYDTTGSVNLEAADVNVVAHVHRLPSTDVTSNDDTAPLLSNIRGDVDC